MATITREELERDYVKKSDLTGKYIKKSDLPSDADMAKYSELLTKYTVLNTRLDALTDPDYVSTSVDDAIITNN